MAVDSTNDVPSRTNRPRRMARTNRATSNGQDHPGDEIQHVPRVQTSLAHGVKMGLHAQLHDRVLPRTKDRKVCHRPRTHKTHHGSHNGQQEGHKRLGRQRRRPTKPRPVNAPENTTKPR